MTAQVEDREETFVGASFVGARPSDAAARATLDALNRRIYNLTIQTPRQADEEEPIETFGKNVTFRSLVKPT